MARIEDKSGPVTWYRIVAHLTLLLLLAQPFLAGQFTYGGEQDLKDVHAGIGQFLHLTVLAQLVLSFFARRTFGIGLIVFNAILLVLVTIQAGIGFSDDGDLIAIHIPLGTILLTLGTVAVLLSFFDLRRQRRPEPTQSIDTR
jgi:hypothetical protein